MTLRSWDTLSTRFIVVITLALILSKALSAAIVQIDLERIVTWNVAASQAADARRWLALDTPSPDQWLSDTPAASDARPASDIADRLSQHADQPVIAGWTPITAGAPFQTQAVQSNILQAMEVLVVSAPTADGRWRNIMIGPRMRLWPMPAPMVISLTASLIGVAAAAALVGARVARPFQALAASADRLSRGERHQPLTVWGPTDVRQAQTAFNSMAARVDATMTGQRALLAALGHDLRTPVTAMRIRAEMIDDEETRARFVRSLDELERLTEAALAAGTDSFAQDTPESVDLNALVEAVCADFEDTGAAVSITTPEDRVITPAWPGALRRATRNLVENAVRYGDGAQVTLSMEKAGIVIQVDDRGPGIPEEDLSRVTAPLVRLEGSRSKETGGHGLGLAIAKSVAEGHGGALTLSNRVDGGLSAAIVLPVW